ncbi:MAG: hypothetical protein K6E85_02985 [Lachnospiraceae bacterium]|nr:hypothetical protein [Lachnospiraceae bacterium]
MRKILFIVGIAGIIAGVLALHFSAFSRYAYYHTLDGSGDLYRTMHRRMIVCLITGIVLTVLGVVCIVIHHKENGGNSMDKEKIGNEKPETKTDVETNNNAELKTSAGILIEFRYSPGYSDMNGASHSESLKKDENGKWLMTCRDCEEIGEPTLVTVYSVSDEAVADFLSFVENEKILSLKDRNDSNDYAMDYSEWGYYILFDNSAAGGKRREIYNIGEYKEYSDKDYELLKELNQRFRNLRGEKISETKEKE